ncbi:MAG: hypothetical protein IT370_07570 [Deltaproteobacteria bacterium]|nr:hypothetical protein [Deltaproteobacteria bacterium]
MARTALIYCVLAAALLTLPAGADAASFRIAVSGTLPFSQDELAQVVGARVELSQDASATMIEIAGSPGRVAVSLLGRKRTVDLGAQRGSRAARLVALVVSDLMLEAAVLPSGDDLHGFDEAPAATDDGAVDTDDGVVADDPDESDEIDEPIPGAPRPTARPRPVASAAPAPAPARTRLRPRSSPRPAPARRRPAGDAAMAMDDDGTISTVRARSSGSGARSRFQLSMIPGLGIGTDDSGLITEQVAVGLSGPLLSRRFLVEVAALLVPTARVPSGDGISMSEQSMRVGYGDRHGVFSAFIGPHFSIYQLDGARDSSRVGFGGRLLATPRLVGALRLAISGSLDYYFNRIHVLIGGQEAFSTPRLNLQLGLGLAWNL